MSRRGALVGVAVVCTGVFAGGAGYLTYEAREAANDRASALAAVEQMYAVISGPAGQQRDWDEFRACFAEDGKLTFFTQGRPAQGEQEAIPPRRITWTPDEYVERAGAHMASNAFYERSTWNKVQVFGRMAHVMSAYETLTEPGGEAVARGVNSFQLVRDPADPESEWKVLLICWDTESPERPIPAEMTAEVRADVPTGD